MPDASRSAPLPPGSTIGILGSGQLGRMLALAAARIGLKTHIYCEESGPAFDVATRTSRGAFEDEAALSAFAREVDAVTYEFENVPIRTAHVLAGLVPVRPSAKALEVAQDRLAEKQFISGLSIPVAPFRAVDGPGDIASGLAAFGSPAILKTRRLGYDGKGQAAIAPGEDAAAAWQAIGARPAVLEQRISFALELSALVVRSLDGALAFYDCPRNTHQGGILRLSVVPSGVPEAHLAEAREIAATIARALDYVGVLAVEMFYLGADARAGAGAGARLVVNEIAPRVHNSGHWTIEACGISQFENHIRAVAGWPLGSPDRHSDAEMRNLIGREALDWASLAATPGTCLHLYGKRDAREGRKMGHVTRLTAKTGPQ
ncbi:MAG: 5-(carboxyamino)imidazole ribonucleotide synthase [Hyphomicrobiaceae bacterium]|nr:MAG: 5-(carboxyamino)imidazole ribonucleotide synthase [Hyphomicrobiaceae bacterium]